MKKNETYKGFETWFSSMEMTFKMHVHILMLLLFFQGLVITAGGYLLNNELYDLYFKYLYHIFTRFEMPDLGLLWKFSKVLFIKSLVIVLPSFAVYLLYPIVLTKFKLRANDQAASKYIRGAKLITITALQKAIDKDDEKCSLPLGDVQMPVSAEPKHSFIVGRPGVGKTVLMSQIIEKIRAKQGRAVIYDFKGDYLSRFYDPQRDIIFNPLDIRSKGWSIFNEIESVMDVDAISASLIPPAGQADPFWNDAARDVFAGILHYLYQSNKRTNKDVWEAVTAPCKDIAAWLQKTKGGERGYRYIEDASSKQAMSVMAVMMQFAKAFEYMSDSDGDFSIKKWLESQQAGFIFVTNYSDIKDTLRPILSLLVDLMGRKLLSLKDDYNRRIFFLLDEFGTLQKLSTIIQLLTLSRSKGGSAWIGIQDIGQIDKLYGKELKSSIVNACGTTAMFSVSDPDTAKFLSDKIGETEYQEMEENYSMGVGENRDGNSMSFRKKTEKLVLPSEISNLKDLTAYLKLPNYDLTKIQISWKKYDDQIQSFMMKPQYSLANIAAEQARITEDAEQAEGGNFKPSEKWSLKDGKFESENTKKAEADKDRDRDREHEEFNM